MSDDGLVRQADPNDAAACAGILNDWIDTTPWMPRVHTRQGVTDFYTNIALRQFAAWVVGDPVLGFATLDRDSNTVMALYVSTPGKGHGKLLLDRTKQDRADLQLWTFEANTGAQAFYKREGFAEVRRTDGDNEEGLPDLLMRWEAS